MASLRNRHVQDLDSVLRNLYGALAEDLSFFHCLETVALPLRSHITAVHHEDFDAHRSWLEVTGQLSREEVARMMQDYASRWHGQNLWMNRGMTALLTRGFGEGDETTSAADLLASSYYRHFLKRADIRYGLGICLWHDGPGKLAVASFNRHISEGAFDKDTMAFVAALRPHMVNVYSIYRHATQLEDAHRSLRATLERAPIGILVLEVTGRILECNVEGERQLSLQAGVARDATGKLVLKHWADQRRLAVILRELSTGADTSLTRSLVVSSTVCSATNRIVMHFCTVPARPLVASVARIIVFLSPLSGYAAEKLDLHFLQSALSLTPAEARVLIELRRSYDVGAVGAALGVSVTTVRTHLKHAFAKTETRRQSELLTMVDRVIAAAPRVERSHV